MKIWLFLFLVSSLWGQSQIVYGNYSTDLKGTQDTRPDTWGFTDAVFRTTTFSPPPGMSVVLDGINGDIMAFPTDTSLVSLTPGMLSNAGLLAGFTISSSPTMSASGVVAKLRSKVIGAKDSNLCDWCADNSPFYRQGAVGLTSPLSVGFAVNYPTGYILPGNNQLTSVIAVFLNTIGMIHIELTYAITFHYKKEEK